MGELKPCPFCGSNALVETFTTAAEKVPRYRIRCAQCPCDIGWDHFSLEEAQAVWNRRPAPIAPEEYEGTFYCGTCHETINSGDKYCHECGKAVKWDD